MAIRFNDSQGWGFVDVKEPENIVVHPDDLKRKAMDSVLKAARLDCPNLPGNRGKRICEMISIAERLKYPKNWDLWYYERSIVDEYIDSMRTGPGARRNDEVHWRQGSITARRSIRARDGGSIPFRRMRVKLLSGAAIAGDRCTTSGSTPGDQNKSDLCGYAFDVPQQGTSASLFGPLVGSFPTAPGRPACQNNPDTLYYPFVKYPN